MKKINTDLRTVYAFECNNYEEKKVYDICGKIISETLRENNIDIKGKRVLIKPNLLAKRTPEKGITTHPVFVESAALYLYSLGAERVIIADSPGGTYNKAVLSGIYKITGMEEATEKSGAELNFDTGSVEISGFGGVKVKTFEVTNITKESDLTINICRLKTHALCEMSAAVKNMFGSIPGLMKAEMHARFPKRDDFAAMLTDLCLAAAPQINIVDAVYGMEGNGPAGGTLKKVGLILGSSNPFVLDTVCAELIGYGPSEVGTVHEAVERGFSPEKTENINICGADIKKYSVKFKRPDGTAGGLLKQLPTIFGGRLQKWLEPKPYINKEKCVGCCRCAACCPQKTIKIISGKALIDYEKCIKCYCCQELCPKHAVDVKRNFFLKF